MQQENSQQARLISELQASNKVLCDEKEQCAAKCSSLDDELHKLRLRFDKTTKNFAEAKAQQEKLEAMIQELNEVISSKDKDLEKQKLLYYYFNSFNYKLLHTFFCNLFIISSNNFVECIFSFLFFLFFFFFFFFFFFIIYHFYINFNDTKNDLFSEKEQNARIQQFQQQLEEETENAAKVLYETMQKRKLQTPISIPEETKRHKEDLGKDK